MTLEKDGAIVLTLELIWSWTQSQPDIVATIHAQPGMRTLSQST